MADEKRPELEFIAGDPANVFNVYKALKSCTTEMRNLSTQAKTLSDIEKNIKADLESGSISLKKLRLTNIEIESVLKRLDKLDTAKLNRTRDIDWITKQISKANKELATLMSNQLQVQKELVVEEKNKENKEKIRVGWTRNINELLSRQFGSLGNILGAWTETGSILFVVFTIVKEIVKIFDQLDTAAFEFRQEMGFTRNYTGDIDKFARAGATSMAQLSVTGKKMYEAAAGISKELFSSANITQEMMNNVALISAQLGVSAQSAAELLKNLGIVSRSAASTQQSTLYFAAALSEAAGTSLPDVMNDISNATKNAYQFISRSSLTMVKAAVEAKRMGTSIESATKSSSFLLNFTQSVNAEMEASVLLGKSINLQKARELSYHRDIRGLNAEILRIIKETNFENLDPFQQNAVAAALGKSAGELAQMAQAERERLNMVRAMTPEQKKQYDMYQSMMSDGEKQKKDYAEIARTQLMQLSNQTRLTAISASWNEIVMQLAYVFLPLVDNTLGFIAKYFGIIKWVSITIGSVWLANKLILMATNLDANALGISIGNIYYGSKKLIASNTVGITGLIKKLWAFKGFGPAIISVFSSIGTSILGLFSSIGSGLLAAVMSPITWIIAAFAVGFGIGTLLNKFKFVQKTAQDFFLLIFKIGDAFKKGILNGLLAVGKAIIYALFSPFILVYNMVMSIFGGKSPSKLGLSIVKGIIAVQGMLINALLYPFTKVWSLIKKLPFVSHFFGNKNIGVNAAPEIKTAMTVEKPKVGVDVDKTNKSTEMPAVSSMSDELTKRMSDIVDAINGLREDMKNGKLTANVFLDSQKLDAGIGRRLNYTGQLI